MKTLGGADPDFLPAQVPPPAEIVLENPGGAAGRRHHADRVAEEGTVEGAGPPAERKFVGGEPAQLERRRSQGVAADAVAVLVVIHRQGAGLLERQVHLGADRRRSQLAGEVGGGGVIQERCPEEGPAVGAQHLLVRRPGQDRGGRRGRRPEAVVVQPLPIVELVVGREDVELRLEWRRRGPVVEDRAAIRPDVAVGRRQDGHEGVAGRPATGGAPSVRASASTARKVTPGKVAT